MPHNLQHQLVYELEKRLPELEWQLSFIGRTIPSKILPRGLFRHHQEYDNHSLMVEIHDDLNNIKNHLNQASGYYLAMQLKQKINVLVALCHQQNKKHRPVQNKSLILDRICTRSGRLNDIEAQMTLLKQQQKRLLEKLKEVNQNDPEIYLAVQKDIGVLEKKLSQAQDSYDALLT